MAGASMIAHIPYFDTPHLVVIASAPLVCAQISGKRFVERSSCIIFGRPTVIEAMSVVMFSLAYLPFHFMDRWKVKASAEETVG